MKSFGLIAVLAAAVMAAPGVYAQAAAPAAGGMTVQCKDGTSVTVTSMRGACHGHKGVDKSATSGSSAGTSTKASTAAAAAAPAAATAPAAAAATTKSSMSSKSMPAAEPAAGGGAGQVWVNTGSKSKAYHCEGGKWYGKTKAGKYMSASDAQAAGYHAAKDGNCK